MPPKRAINTVKQAEKAQAAARKKAAAEAKKAAADAKKLEKDAKIIEKARAAAAERLEHMTELAEKASADKKRADTAKSAAAKTDKRGPKSDVNVVQQGSDSDSEDSDLKLLEDYALTIPTLTSPTLKRSASQIRNLLPMTPRLGEYSDSTDSTSDSTW